MPEKSNGLTKFSKIVAMGAVAIVGLSSNAMAADPAWFTDLTTQLSGIQIMVLAVLASVISISLAPLAWGFVKKVLHRG